MKLIDREPTPEMLQGAEGLERDITANLWRIMYDAAPEVNQDPVAIVDANDEGYWADILPDRSVKVGQPLFAYHPDAQAEIAKRDERIESLTSAGAEYQRQCFEQAKRIEELEFSWAGCSQQLKDACDDLNRAQEHSRMQALSIADHVDVRGEQAAEISRLKGVIAKCEAAIDSHLNPCGCFNGCEFCSGKESLEESLAAIKEIDHATD